MRIRPTWVFTVASESDSLAAISPLDSPSAISSSTSRSRSVRRASSGVSRAGCELGSTEAKRSIIRRVVVGATTASPPQTARPDGGPRVLILTTFDLDEYAFAALKAGASGFLLKDVPPAELVAAIHAVHEGEAVVAPTTTRRMIDRFATVLPSSQPPQDTPEMARLTEREREVLLLIATGLSNGEIAARLSLSEATVKTHVGRILTKLELRDRVQAVVLAYETGLVRAGGL